MSSESVSTWSGMRNKLEKESMERELEWVQAFYVIRMQAEGLLRK